VLHPYGVNTPGFLFSTALTITCPQPDHLKLAQANGKIEKKRYETILQLKQSRSNHVAQV